MLDQSLQSEAATQGGYTEDQVHDGENIVATQLGYTEDQIHEAQLQLGYTEEQIRNGENIVATPLVAATQLGYTNAEIMSALSIFARGRGAVPSMDQPAQTDQTNVTPHPAK